MKIQSIGITAQKSNLKKDYNPNFTSTFGIYNKRIYQDLPKDAIAICKNIAKEKAATFFKEEEAGTMFGKAVYMGFDDEKNIEVLTALHNQLNLSAVGIVKT